MRELKPAVPILVGSGQAAATGITRFYCGTLQPGKKSAASRAIAHISGPPSSPAMAERVVILVQSGPTPAKNACRKRAHLQQPPVNWFTAQVASCKEVEDG